MLYFSSSGQNPVTDSADKDNGLHLADRPDFQSVELLYHELTYTNHMCSI